MTFHHRPLKDIMEGVQSAQLSRELPIDTKMLICNMSIGFTVYCAGTRVADLDKKGINDRRDIKCLVEKFSPEEPRGEDWICWPCLDYLKKSKQKVWKHRTRPKSEFSCTKKPRRFGTVNCSFSNKKFQFSKKEPEMLEDVKTSFVTELRCGDFKVSVAAVNNRRTYFYKSLELRTKTIPQYPFVRKCSPGISTNLRYH